jgi:hypothetical protein
VADFNKNCQLSINVGKLPQIWRDHSRDETLLESSEDFPKRGTILQ